MNEAEKALADLETLREKLRPLRRGPSPDFNAGQRAALRLSLKLAIDDLTEAKDRLDKAD